MTYFPGGYIVGSAKALHQHIDTMTSHPIYTVDLSAASASTTAAVREILTSTNEVYKKTSTLYSVVFMP